VALGLFKKLVVADRLMPFLNIHGGFAGWCASALLYAVTIYCDFTGGLDIAIGVARMFGVKLSENFDRPFYAKSITEYWRRWHITMGSWFRDYIFYPLSVWKPVLRLSKIPALGRRMGKRVPVWAATLVTWLATGLWHGATWNFVLWGFLNGLVILVSQEMAPLFRSFGKNHSRIAGSRLFAAFQVVRTFLLVAAIRSLDLLTLAPSASKKGGLLSLPVPVIAAVSAAVLLLVLAEHKIKKLQAPASRLAAALALSFLALVFGAYGIGYNSASFIYTRF
jgi:D-alanyl-lipoteichoic acid acyltransferase DltB (MBOAT superfamily)